MGKPVGAGKSNMNALVGLPVGTWLLDDVSLPLPPVVEFLELFGMKGVGKPVGEGVSGKSNINAFVGLPVGTWLLDDASLTLPPVVEFPEFGMKAAVG